VLICAQKVKNENAANLFGSSLQIVPETIRFRLASHLFVECPLTTSGTSSYVFWRPNSVDLISRYSIQLNETMRLLHLQNTQKAKLNDRLRYFRSFKSAADTLALGPTSIDSSLSKPKQKAGHLLVCKVMDQNRVEYGNITLQLSSSRDERRFRSHVQHFFESDSSKVDARHSATLKLLRDAPPLIQRKLGETVRLSCPVVSSTGESVQTVWFKDDHMIASTEHTYSPILPSDVNYKRYLLRNGRLTIRSIGREDVGKYTCLAYTQFARLNTTTDLQITGLTFDNLRSKSS
jgi:hypothetical protein